MSKRARGNAKKRDEMIKWIMENNSHAYKLKHKFSSCLLLLLQEITKIKIHIPWRNEKLYINAYEMKILMLI